MQLPRGWLRTVSNALVVLSMAGMQWNSNDYASGGLQLSYCLNTTDIGGTCGCDMTPPDTSSCIALVDHHDGRYSGAFNGSAIGARNHASFRFFQRVADYSPNGELTEIVSTVSAAFRLPSAIGCHDRCEMPALSVIKYGRVCSCRMAP